MGATIVGSKPTTRPRCSIPDLSAPTDPLAGLASGLASGFLLVGVAIEELDELVSLSAMMVVLLAGDNVFTAGAEVE